MLQNGAAASSGGQASQAFSCVPGLSGNAARVQEGASVLALLEPRPAVSAAYVSHEVHAVTAARAACFAAQSPAQVAAWRTRFGARYAGVVAQVALEGGHSGEHCDDALQARRPTRLCVGVSTSAGSCVMPGHYGNAPMAGAAGWILGGNSVHTHVCAFAWKRAGRPSG